MQDFSREIRLGKLLKRQNVQVLPKTSSEIRASSEIEHVRKPTRIEQVRKGGLPRYSQLELLGRQRG